MFQSQTGSQALSDSLLGGDINRDQQVSIPNGKPGPLRRFTLMRIAVCNGTVSIPNGKPGPLRRIRQPDDGAECLLVSIPNGKPGPLRPCDYHRPAMDG